MKTTAFNLPPTMSREFAIAIIDQLPSNEFVKAADDMKRLSRERAFASLDRLRSAVRRSGLRKKDFDKALEEVRASKRKSASLSRS